MKSATMICWDFDPFYVAGGSAYATRRLADQLTGLGIETRVLMPDRPDTFNAELAPLLLPIPITIDAEFRRAPAVVQFAEFCRAAAESIERVSVTSGSDVVVAHSDEAAMFFVMRNGNQSGGPAVFWLHSLYDPPIDELSEAQRRLLPAQSLLASAVTLADIVVTSDGILKDAQAFEWPDRLKELQRALLDASSQHRVLTVESVGCLSEVAKNSGALKPNTNLDSLRNLTSPYVLFPCRPMIDKGLGFFAAIAERLSADKIASVAVRPPRGEAKLQSPSVKEIHWLPWLSQEELQVAMRNAACTVFPSITEGFGLAAAESIRAGVRTLYQEVGGHHGLRGYPQAQSIPLSPSEREQLYCLWSDLIGTHPDSWPVWRNHEIALRPLIDRWVEAIRSVVYGANDTETFSFADLQLANERWGNKLRQRIEAGIVSQ